MSVGGIGTRILRAGAALIALAALLLGVPWFLLTFTEPALFLRVDWWDALIVGADSRVVLALLAVVGWAAWGVVALTIALELLSVLSRQRLRLQLPGTGWLRPLVGALVVAAVAAPSVASADVAPHPPDASAGAPTATAATETPAEATPVPRGRHYLVQPGDELWSVAERELGSGDRWREVVALNPGLSSEAPLEQGATLLLPEDASWAPPTVVVEKGDTLWHIAESQLGDPTRWPEIHEANLDQIADPDQIDVGWALRIPADRPQPESSEGAPLAPAEREEVQRSPEPAADRADGADAAAEAVAEAFGGGFVEADRSLKPAPYPDEPPNLGGTEGVEVDAAAEAETGDRAADADSADEFFDLLAPVGAAMAGAVLVGVGTRRRAQLLARAVGRRLVPVPAQVARFWTALSRRAAHDDGTADGMHPTSLVLGWDGEVPIQVELEEERAVVFTGDATQSALNAAVTGLACAPWSAGVEVIVVDGQEWVAALDDPRVSSEPTTTAGLHRLTRLCSERRLALRDRDLDHVRAETDLNDAFSPLVVVYLSPLSPTDLDVVHDALALGRVGVSVVAGTDHPLHSPLTEVHVREGEGSLKGRSFVPQLVTAPARRALIELFAAAGRPDTEPAPWWTTDDDLPPNVLPLPRRDRLEEHPMTPRTRPPHPMLLLLGNVELVGAAGAAPTRAVGQCLEYCAWLLQNPGSTPTLMLRDLQVADTTRRSNMSRLRTWLGADDEGMAYLPDAYTGRLSLDHKVTSDWEHFAAILSGGVNTAGTLALRDALLLVRGEPLGSFAFQWYWAQQWQADMVAMIVDTACVLADRALLQADPETALWAVSRGRLGAPVNDALSVREIEALRLAGRREDAGRAVVGLNRTLRAEGRDLDPALAARVQDSLRPRRASAGPQHLDTSRSAQQGERY